MKVGYIPEAQVDKWALYRVAQYCDQLVPNGLGGFEPRFTCNLYLQTREQAYKVVQDMASIFRGMVYWSGGAITVTQDAPADPVYQFAPSNVVDGEFAYQGSSAKARHTVALVTWNDPEDFYRQKVEYVEDAAGIARYGIVQSEVVALGCTSRGQAHRVGKWLLYSEQSESEIVTFRTGLEGAVVRPGDVIKVADPVRGGMRLGGRIAAATASTVTLDQDLPADLPWRLSVILPTGVVEERLVGPISGRALTVTIPFSAVPQAGAIWVLSSSIIEPQLFRVVAVAERDPGVHEVTALAHNPSKFDAIEKGLALQPRSITVLSDMPPAPTGLSMQESLYRVKDQAQVLVQVSWNEVQTAVAYRLSYRVAGGNFVSLPLTSANYVEIRDAQEGAYPAFPYPSFTYVTREDSDALYAFLKSTPAVERPNQPHRLGFPYNTQAALAVWRALYFRAGAFEPQAEQPAEWNRGRYLVQGLGHCAACHSGRNFLGGTSLNAQFAGGLMPDATWYAPSLATPREAGVQTWQRDEVVKLLKDGVVSHASVSGPMAEVVFTSTQYLSGADLDAMARYLASIPLRDNEPREVKRAEGDVFARGGKLYDQHCASCHGDKGQGVAGIYPALAGNRAVTLSSHNNLVQVIRQGGFMPTTAGNPEPFGMPPFGQVLNNDEIAAVSTFIRQSWGNSAAPVSSLDVLHVK